MPFECKECNFKTDKEGLLWQHWFKHHPNTFFDKQSDLTAELLDKLEELFKTILPNYEIELSYGSRNIIANYEGSEIRENIWVDIEINEYGVPKLNFTICQTYLREEIINPQACHDCFFEDCCYYNEEIEECSQTEEKIQQEIDRWLNKPKLKGRAGTLDWTLQTAIDEIKCYLNVPHYHLYKGIEFSTTLQTISEVETALNAREFILSIYISFLGAIEK